MNSNVNTIDRVIRVVIAVIAAFFAFSASGAVAVILWLVAVIMLGTAAVGFCPLYKLFGISTKK